MKIFAKQRSVFNYGLGIGEGSKILFKFHSLFGIYYYRTNIINSVEIKSIRINKVIYSHYNGGSFRTNIPATRENSNVVYDLDIYDNTSLISIIKRSSDKEKVFRYANFLSKRLDLKIKQKKIDLNQYQTNNLSRNIEI